MTWQIKTHSNNLIQTDVNTTKSEAPPSKFVVVGNTLCKYMAMTEVNHTNNGNSAWMIIVTQVLHIQYMYLILFLQLTYVLTHFRRREKPKRKRRWRKRSRRRRQNCSLPTSPNGSWQRNWPQPNLIWKTWRGNRKSRWTDVTDLRKCQVSYCLAKRLTVDKTKERGWNCGIRRGDLFLLNYQAYWTNLLGW